jgi:hypothetical protein
MYVLVLRWVAILGGDHYCLAFVVPERDYALAFSESGSWI